jgi:predicted nucleic acid-binding protein
MERRKEKIRIVIDANILFSALIKDASITRELITSDDIFDIYCPEFIFKELEKYKKFIISKREKNKQLLTYKESFETLLYFINIIPTERYDDKIKEAYNIMKDIDEKDTYYVALALKLNCPIWSNDTDLKKQNKVKIYNTKELLEELLNDE